MANKKTTAKYVAPPKLTAAEKKSIAKEIKDATFLPESDKAMYLEALKDGHLVKAPRLANFKVKPYANLLTSPCEPHGTLYDVETGKFLPHDAGEIDVCDYLDTLAYACENGKLNTRTWVTTVFQAEDTWEWFLDNLAGYDQMFRIYDRWYFALSRLAEHENVEEGFIQSEEIADKLREHAAETNQVF